MKYCANCKHGEDMHITSQNPVGRTCIVRISADAFDYCDCSDFVIPLIDPPALDQYSRDPLAEASGSLEHKTATQEAASYLSSMALYDLALCKCGHPRKEHSSVVAAYDKACDHCFNCLDFDEYKGGDIATQRARKRYTSTAEPIASADTVEVFKRNPCIEGKEPQPMMLQAAFALECVAHMQGKEQELLHIAEFLRETHKQLAELIENFKPTAYPTIRKAIS